MGRLFFLGRLNCNIPKVPPHTPYMPHPHIEKRMANSEFGIGIIMSEVRVRESEAENHAGDRFSETETVNRKSAKVRRRRVGVETLKLHQCIQVPRANAKPTDECYHRLRLY